MEIQTTWHDLDVIADIEPDGDDWVVDAFGVYTPDGEDIAGSLNAEAEREILAIIEGVLPEQSADEMARETMAEMEWEAADELRRWREEDK